MKYTIFKTIKITKDTPTALIKAIEKEGVFVSDYAKDIASKIETPSKLETANFTIVKLSDWFEKYPMTDEIYARAEKEGLELCPPITGLHLRLDYKDQDKGDYFWIGMKPITDSDGRPRVFSVGRRGGGERWLDTDRASPDDAWLLGSRVVFRLRKETLNSDTSTLGDSTWTLGTH